MPFDAQGESAQRNVRTSHGVGVAFHRSEKLKFL
jgi:hypothetical protein